MTWDSSPSHVPVGCPCLSDETVKAQVSRHIRRDENTNNVYVYKNSEFSPLCLEHISSDTAKYLCSITGSGAYSGHRGGEHVSWAVLALPSDKPDSVIPNHELQHVASCQLLHLTCNAVECGVPSNTVVGDQMIINGQDSQLGEWPWQIALLENGYQICGGTIIDPGWVVTAAHCVDYGPENYAVSAGTLFRSLFTAEAQQRNVFEIHMHPNYTFGSTHRDYEDIALLRLSTPLFFTDNVRPACLANSWEEGDSCFITGWGYVHFDSYEGVFTERLQEVGVTLQNTTFCSEQWSAHITSNVIVQDSVVCADNRNQFNAACYGDSGGPLVCPNDQGRWELVGTLSRGNPGCQRNDFVPVLYTSVSHNLNWIMEKTGITFEFPSTPSPYTGTHPSTTPWPTLSSTTRVSTTSHSTNYTTTSSPSGCMPYPCFDFETCVEANNPQGYMCCNYTSNGYVNSTGQSCFPCYPNPCGNGGSCVARIHSTHGYVCHCLDGTMGDSCPAPANSTGAPTTSSTVSANSTTTTPSGLIFTENVYIFNLLESAPNGTFVGKVTANGDSGMRYSLDGSHEGFVIDPSDGNIYTTDIMDREARSQYTLQVHAELTDSTTYSAAATATVEVILLDVNDNAPIFPVTMYHAEVPQSTPVNDTVLVVSASDRDAGANGELMFSLSPPGQIPFAIYRVNTTFAKIRTNGSLNDTNYIFSVKATDHGMPPMMSQATVNITIT